MLRLTTVHVPVQYNLESTLRKPGRPRKFTQPANWALEPFFVSHKILCNQSSPWLFTRKYPVNAARFAFLLQTFSEHPLLQARISFVLFRLPDVIQSDFSDDPSFQITLEDYSPEQGWKLFMACPSATNSVSRCVVLRRKLEQASEDFALYVIAHEFAHAYLRNGGWGEITDIEEAADALAASWGFRRPQFPQFTSLA